MSTGGFIDYDEDSENRCFFRAIRPVICKQPPGALPWIDWAAAEGLIAKHDADFPTLTSAPQNQDTPREGISPHRLSHAPSIQPAPATARATTEVPTSSVAYRNQSHEAPSVESFAGLLALMVKTIEQPSSNLGVPAAVPLSTPVPPSTAVPPAVITDIVPETRNTQQPSALTDIHLEDRPTVPNIPDLLGNEPPSEKMVLVGSPTGARVHSLVPEAQIVLNPTSEIDISRGPEAQTLAV